jgi:hypothetical protein
MLPRRTSDVRVPGTPGLYADALTDRAARAIPPRAARLHFTTDRDHPESHPLPLRAAPLRSALTCRLAFALAVLLPAGARATGNDFVNETLVATPLGSRELGLEFGSDSRIDRDYRLQGWLTPEIELGLTRALIAEGRASFVDRGRGLELAGWLGEGRCVLLEQGRWPLGLAAVSEFETETSAAKHLSYERVFSIKAVATRTFGGRLLATANWGWDQLLVPIKRHDTSQGAGIRFPEDAPVTYGFEYRRERVERVTQYGPSVRMRLSNRMRLRLGGFVGEGARVYRFVGRAILETEL